MQIIPILVAAGVIVVVAGFVFFRGPVAVPAVIPVSHMERRRERGRKSTHHDEDSTTVWIGALEAGMALVMVLATLAMTDAVTTTRPASNASNQVLVDALPEITDQQAPSANTAGGSALVHPTHRLIALGSAAADAGPIIIELDAPLRPDRPLKFLINTPTNSSPQ